MRFRRASFRRAPFRFSRVSLPRRAQTSGAAPALDVRLGHVLAPKRGQRVGGVAVVVPVQHQAGQVHLHDGAGPERRFLAVPVRLPADASASSSARPAQNLALTEALTGDAAAPSARARARRATASARAPAAAADDDGRRAGSRARPRRRDVDPTPPPSAPTAPTPTCPTEYCASASVRSGCACCRLAYRRSSTRDAARPRARVHSEVPAAERRSPRRAGPLPKRRHSPSAARLRRLRRRAGRPAANRVLHRRQMDGARGPPRSYDALASSTTPRVDSSSSSGRRRSRDWRSRSRRSAASAAGARAGAVCGGASAADAPASSRPACAVQRRDARFARDFARAVLLRSARLRRGARDDQGHAPASRAAASTASRARRRRRAEIMQRTLLTSARAPAASTARARPSLDVPRGRERAATPPTSLAVLPPMSASGSRRGRRRPRRQARDRIRARPARRRTSRRSGRASRGPRSRARGRRSSSERASLRRDEAGARGKAEGQSDGSRARRVAETNETDGRVDRGRTEKASRVPAAAAGFGVAASAVEKRAEVRPGTHRLRARATRSLRGREPRLNEKAQSTHLRVAVVQHDAIAALHRHHRRPVGARGGSLDASYVPPERDARAVAVGRHAHAASVTTPALRAVSDDAPTAVGERLCVESTGRRREGNTSSRQRISFFSEAPT